MCKVRVVGSIDASGVIFELWGRSIAGRIQAYYTFIVDLWLRMSFLSLLI